MDAAAQATSFVGAVGSLLPGDLPPVLDVETTDGQSAATIAAGVATWMDQVEVSLGRRPMIYTARSFWNDSVASAAFAADALWAAHWNVVCPDLPAAWSDWTFHQYSSTGTVAGITGDVDLDRFNGTEIELSAFAGCVGATGAHCENAIVGCDPNPCLNGGTCESITGGFSCTCADGFVGMNCGEQALLTPDSDGGGCAAQGSNVAWGWMLVGLLARRRRVRARSTA